jgi:hypothetical protein
LQIISEQLTLLSITQRFNGEDDASSGAQYDKAVQVISPRDVETYQPAGHKNTANRCLFVNDQVEIIEGVIEAGGGAERHSHEDLEQFLYVLNGESPILIYYPKGVAHGTGGGIDDRLELLVVYSPPLAELQDARD